MGFHRDRKRAERRLQCVAQDKIYKSFCVVFCRKTAAKHSIQAVQLSAT